MFEATPDKEKYAITSKFSRASTFFRDKSGAVQKKTCMLELLVADTEQPSPEVVGSIEVDLGPMLGKENISQTY